MTTPRLAYLAKILEDRYGVIGKVASRYVKAGYSVELNHPTRHGAIEILARGNKGEVLAIEVVDSKKDLSISSVEKFLEKSKLIRAKPILVIYGGVELPEDVYKFCKEKGVRIRRFRAE
ncbi:MAG: hypothetical protein QXU13_04465 [Desulfurococcaceae archaeon]